MRKYITIAAVATIAVTAALPVTKANAGWGGFFRDLGEQVAQQAVQNAVDSANQAAAQQAAVNAQACQSWLPIVTDMRYPYNYRVYASNVAAQYCR